MISETQEVKTATEWFEGFPEPYRKQAIRNFKKFSGKDFEKHNATKYPAPHDALFESFPWSKSTEGLHHWKDIYDALEAGKSWDEIIKEAK